MDARQILAKDESSPSIIQPSDVAANKVHAFNGRNKKSRFEKDQEAALKKKQEEEAEAARAYDEFVAAFGVDEDVPSGSNGARGGGFKPVRTAGKGFVRAGGEGVYNPLKDREVASRSGGGIPAQSTSKASYVRPMETGPRAMLMGDEEEIKKPSGPPGKKKRDMDNFLEELKRDQKEREERLGHIAGRSGTSITALAAREHAPTLTGSYDAGDPLTTNVHVGNLPPTATESALGMYFAQFGPVGSVKIMWPRADSAPSRQLGGFVAFLRRPDAEAAVKEVEGANWLGNALHTSWGKAVPVPPRAIYEIEGAGNRRNNDRGNNNSSRRNSDPRFRSRSRSRSPDLRRRRGGGRSSRSPSYSDSDDDSRRRSSREWPVLESPEDEKFLKKVAAKVREHGDHFESVMRERERDNVKFAFFWDEKLPSYHYFKMLVDDRYHAPIVNKLEFTDEGNADIYSTDSSEDSENERVRKGKLGKLAQRRFESLLRSLTPTREKIARGMAFALEHADAASIVVDILVASLTLDSTPVPRKIARLSLISDILHNSSASIPNAWVYRSTFERKLPQVFDHLGDIYLSFPGRMKAEQFKMQVVNILDVWERDWIIFEPGVIEDFKRRLFGTPLASSTRNPEPTAEEYQSAASLLASLSAAAAPTPEGTEEMTSTSTDIQKKEKVHPGFKTSSFQPATLNSTTPDEEDVDGEGINVDGDEIDVDGVELGDGEIDGAPLEVDGEAVEIDVDVDGEPLQVDGEVIVFEDDEEDDAQPMELEESDDDIF